MPPELSLPSGGGQRASLQWECVFWEEMYSGEALEVTSLNYSFHDGLGEKLISPFFGTSGQGVHAMKLKEQMEIK